MPVSKGIDVQKSRFAALALETSSDSDEDEGGNWETVKKTAHKPGGPKLVPKKGGEPGGESKPLSKSAKKRARKKKQQQAQVANEVCIEHCNFVELHASNISTNAGFYLAAIAIHRLSNCLNMVRTMLIRKYVSGIPLLPQNIPLFK